MSTGKRIYRRFGESYCLHLQDHVVQEELYLTAENPGVNREGETFLLIVEVRISYPGAYTAHLLICNQLGYRNDWPADYHSSRFIFADWWKLRRV